MKKLLLICLLIQPLIHYGQNLSEKLEVDRKEYQSLLLRCNEVADNLKSRHNEVNLLMRRDSLSMAEIEGLAYQIEQQKKYAKHIKKQKRKAWVNGFWQGGAVGGGLVFALILL